MAGRQPALGGGRARRDAGRVGGADARLPQEVSITYLVAPWARGKGVAQRAIRAASRFAFDNMGMHRVSWDAIVGNHASRLAAIRVGFTVEGISRNGVSQRGVSRDCWVGGAVPGELRESDDPPPDYGVLKAQAAFFMGERPEVETEAEGLRLRPLREGDLDDLAASCADEETQRWTSVPRDYKRDDADKFFSLSAERWKRGTHVLYALADAEDRFSGSVELMLDGRPPGEAEIGYQTAPWARGRGWMTAAVRAVTALGFEHLALERIEWRATVGNEPSAASPRRRGSSWKARNAESGTVRANGLTAGRVPCLGEVVLPSSLSPRRRSRSSPRAGPPRPTAGSSPSWWRSAPTGPCRGARWV
ncbi:hypothetical protein GCM10029992_02690 [Glycomyces albus]